MSHPIPLRLRRAIAPFIALCLAACAPSAPPASDSHGGAATFRYAEADVASLQQAMASGELDSQSLTRAYLQRIARLDRQGPQLHAVIELNPAAVAEAGARDRERRDGHLRGPLHGIPILLKDNINASPMRTTAGSLALASFSPGDAFLVQRLRQAGAVILGKTNLSEWANYRGAPSISGWSAVGGQTRNPYRLDHSPCGSSSGSAVAAAANLATLTVGTETDGSIVCPASMNGVVGLKPTVGLVSRHGIVPISFSQDTAGPITRSVADAALLLTAMVGRDEADPATATAPGRAVYDYSERLQADRLRGARIGVLQGPVNALPGMAALLQRAVDDLRGAGATVIAMPALDEQTWSDNERTLLAYEFNAGLQRYLKAWNAPLADLPALIAFNQAHANVELTLFGQELFEDAAQRGPLGEPAYIQARNQARRAAGEQGIDALLRAHDLEALVAPTTGPAWPIASPGGDAYPGGSGSAAAVAGYPSLSVPMGEIDGLPVGLLFIGTAWSEPRLLELGYSYEQQTRARRPPPL